ncbi:hypothetical protein ABEB36_001570 [Hypothenemus hampei]|uniref:Kinesin-like protein n=1 Tax=Hypothenemus hampei TaxID=57062 RepID=A0ABD1FFM0_HYPHA
MLKNKIVKVPNMVKTVKKVDSVVTPRRRISLGKSGGAIEKVSKVLSRPVSGVPRVSPNCNIRVIVRVRPTNEKEQQENYQNVVKVIDDQMLIFDPKDDEQPFFYHGVQQKRRDLLKKPKRDVTFVFDRVFNDNSSNIEVFTNSTKSLIDALMDGCNCSVFAYGATGAGKTFTMIGNTECPGITYLTMRELFQRKNDLSAEREFELMVTYIEVYNELVKDLLNPGQPLNLREDSKFGVVISGVKGHKINDPEEMFNLLRQGNKRRTQHPTDANAESSRSHAVFQVYIQMTIKGTREVRRAKLSMIDLAGSERGSSTGYVGARFKEGANINKSLLALGNCINSLADGHRHVPYRDSKLTRLLKDSLGGNCHTIMIANISPSSLSFDDTYNTLKYANQAKRIKTNITRNIVNVDMHVDQYIKLVSDLQTENASLKAEVAQLKSELLGRSTPEATSASVSCNEQKRSSLNKTHVIEQALVSNEQENVDPTSLQFFNAFVDKKKVLLEREFQLQSSELGMSVRRKLNNETEARLSIFYLDTPTKEETRKKLNEQAQRHEKKEIRTNAEIQENRKLQVELDGKIAEILDIHPELNEINKFAMLEIEALKNKYERDLEKKEKNLILDEYNAKCKLLESMANLTGSLFLAVGGKDDAPKHIKKKYEELVATFDGKKCLRWRDDDTKSHLDSGLSSLTSIQSAPEDKCQAPKRKIELDSQVSLEITSRNNESFTISKNSSPAASIVAKAYKNPSAKRLALAVSPRRRMSPQSKTPPRGKLTSRNRDRLPGNKTPRPDTARLNGKKAVTKSSSSRPKWI